MRRLDDQIRQVGREGSGFANFFLNDVTSEYHFLVSELYIGWRNAFCADLQDSIGISVSWKKKMPSVSAFGNSSKTQTRPCPNLSCPSAAQQLLDERSSGFAHATCDGESVKDVIVIGKNISQSTAIGLPDFSA